MRTLALALTLLATGANAQVFKCTDVSGKVAFQQRPCADGHKAEAVKIRSAPEPPPPSEPAPAPAGAATSAPETSAGAADAQAAAPPPAAPQRRGGPQSWRCTAAGRTWYRHKPCPAYIDVPEYVVRSDGSLGSQILVPKLVKETQVSRTEACNEITRAASVSREGAHLDENPTPYEKMKHGDPC